MCSPRATDLHIGPAANAASPVPRETALDLRQLPQAAACSPSQKTASSIVQHELRPICISSPCILIELLSIPPPVQQKCICLLSTH